MSSIFYQIAADAVVTIHFAFVNFVLFGQILILIGLFAKWKWIRNFYFRMIHLLCIMVVVYESVSGITCPLTTWEHELRNLAGESSYSGDFIPNLLHNMMFFEAEPWVFTLCYVLFGAVVLLTFIFAPPRKPYAGKNGQEENVIEKRDENIPVEKG